MDEFEFNEKIDCYAGCYRLYRKFASVPMVRESTDEVFDKIKSLEINPISVPKCCFHPQGLTHMIDNISTQTMVHICTACYGQALQNLPEGSQTLVLMLPDFIEKVKASSSQLNQTIKQGGKNGLSKGNGKISRNGKAERVRSRFP